MKTANQINGPQVGAVELIPCKFPTEEYQLRMYRQEIQLTISLLDEIENHLGPFYKPQVKDRANKLREIL